MTRRENRGRPWVKQGLDRGSQFDMPGLHYSSPTLHICRDRRKERDHLINVQKELILTTYIGL
jgi:hypothetical protein